MVSEAGEVVRARQPPLAEHLEVLAMVEKPVHLWAEPAASLCKRAGMGRPEVTFTLAIFIVTLAVCCPTTKGSSARGPGDLGGFSVGSSRACPS